MLVVVEGMSERRMRKSIKGKSGLFFDIASRPRLPQKISLLPSTMVFKNDLK